VNTFTVQLSVTERSLQRVQVEADTPEEAIRLVEEYEVDNSHFNQIDCLEYSYDNVGIVT
jgi:hypothetical protein